MFSTLLGLLKSLSNPTHALNVINTWAFINSHVFYFKLQNVLSFYTYNFDFIKINSIIIWKRNFNFFFTINTLSRFFLIICIVLVF